ncbi:MAG: hypothetical protein WCS74_03195 [Dehalococcoidales bacterium]|jgi:ABC-type transport system substrate-binding protein|nr:hypothetical protein [Dehalococcoidales bacterium]MDD4794730.1 hypothetical protein [Dehalococcoidales bacterium]MDD5122345.1 hypothetical protein [Dehalococcoidales bacterium]MDD5499027.1 hypothetical protein [Dehalococcoidales bacterium]
MMYRSMIKRILIFALLVALSLTAIACESEEPTTNPLSTNPTTTTQTTTTAKPTTTTTQPTTSQPTTTEPTTTPSNQSPVSLGIRRADIQDELALNMFVKPVDENGNVVAVEGTLNVKVWEMLDAFDITQKGELLQSWDGIQIVMDDYETEYGEALVRITYEDFLPEWWQYGIVDLELVYDGGKLEGSDDLLLGKIPGC